MPCSTGYYFLFLDYHKKYITLDKSIAGGTTVFKGTRVAVKTLFDYPQKSSPEEYINGHPSVSREQAKAMIEQAAQKIFTVSAYNL